MKLLLLLLSATLTFSPSKNLMVVDRDLKKPCFQADDFTTQLYLRRTFPVYTDDIPQVLEAVIQAAKKVEQERPVWEAVRIPAGHTSVVICTSAENRRELRVSLITEMEGTAGSYSFLLVPGEEDERRIQRRLLDFTDYLSQ